MWQALVGIPCLLFIAWIFSENKKAIPWQRLGIGIFIQFLVALVFLKIPLFAEALLYLNVFVQAVEKATAAGAGFMFGYLAGAEAPFVVEKPGANFIIAFRILPIVLVMSALSAVLFHWGVLQKLVGWFSDALRKTLKIDGPQGFGVAANVYLGIVEAPLFIRPYLKSMSRSSLFVVMSAGMATVAGTVMVLYASILNPILPGAIGHILVASIISAPAVILIGQLMVPATENDEGPEVLPEVEVHTKGTLDAIVVGTMDGLQLLLNIIAMIVVLFALVSLMNQGLALIPGEPTVQSLLGYVLQPVAWCMGIASSELSQAGQLLGTKLALNEFVAYTQMAALPDSALTEKSKVILTYAMCGFANFASVGLIVGAMGTMIPERRQEIVELSLKALVAGFLATCMTGAIAGLLV